MTSKINFAADLAKQLKSDARQVRFAAALALTRTAARVKEAETAEILRNTDRPTPYTARAVFMSKATKDNLEAVVWLKDDRATSNAGTPATAYLGPLIEGGIRNVKRYERALQAIGAMPQGWYSVPVSDQRGGGARLDQYGNVSRGQITQILSQVGTEQTAGYTRSLPRGKDKKTLGKRRRAFGRAGGQYVVIKPGAAKLKPGIYLATGQDWGAKFGFLRTGKLTPVLLFKQGVRYMRRIDWEGVAQRVTEAALPGELDRALDDAMASAQPRGQTEMF